VGVVIVDKVKCAEKINLSLGAKVAPDCGIVCGIEVATAAESVLESDTVVLRKCEPCVVKDCSLCKSWEPYKGSDDENNDSLCYEEVVEDD